jgi:hypothetical protein
MSITIRLPSGERREIIQERILIGRGARCPICLPEAGHLQEEHARLRKIADRWIVESRGDWLIRVGDAPPTKYGWLKTGDVIRLSQVGPDLVFEPAHEDVVLAGLESPEEAVAWHQMPPPLPSRETASSATPPPLPHQTASRPSTPPIPARSVPARSALPTNPGHPGASRPIPPPLPDQPAPYRSAPPPLPAEQATRATPPPLPGQPSPTRRQPPPLPTQRSTTRSEVLPEDSGDGEGENHGHDDDPLPDRRRCDRERSGPESTGEVEPDEEDDEPGDDPDSPDRSWHTMVGTWVFGTLLLGFFGYVFILGPDKLPEFKQRMLGISCGLLAGLFAYFLTGEIKLRLPEVDGLIGEKSRATGGVGVFALVLLLWSSPFAPIGLAEKVDSIKTDTVAIRSDTQEIKQGVGELGRLGGLIKDPQTPSDFYHNARVQELSGRFAEAFADYDEYVTSNQIFVDPYLAYLQLLRIQQGNETAVDKFGSLRKRFPDNPAIEFVALRLLSGGRRLSALEEFATRHADFGPVIFDMADHFSNAVMSNRTGVDSERERDLLRAFIRSAVSGKFARFYIDKNLAAKLLDDARGRLERFFVVRDG